MADTSNLILLSNLMIDDKAHKDEMNFMPGDLVPLVFPTLKMDTRLLERALSAQQLEEYENNLVCQLCGRKCAGTCTRDRKGAAG